MKYYFDPAVGIRAFESDGSQDFLITEAMCPLTQEEVEAHLNPVVPPDWPQAIAARRYEVEVAGIHLNGMYIDTSDRSKLLINGAVLEVSLNPEYTMQWKTPSGFITLTASEVIAIARAVRAHVQACFDREAVLLQALQEGALTNEMLDQGWPESQ